MCGQVTNMPAWTHKIHLNMCWQNPSNGSEDTKCISTFVDQTSPTPMTTQIAGNHVLTKHNTRQQALNAYQLVLTNPNPRQLEYKIHYYVCRLTLPCQGWHKMHLNSFTKLIQCLRGHKKYLNLCWSNPSNAREHLKWISTRVEQTSHMPAWKQNVSQLVLRAKWISSSVDQTPPIPSRTQNDSHLVSSKSNTC